MKSRDKKFKTVLEEQQDILNVMERLLNFLIKKNEEISNRFKLEEQKERRRMLKGIEEEIENLEKKKDELPDYDNQVAELKKEASRLKEELKIK